ncbi:DUF6907 domain-containing protein [Mycobacterium angelicum]|uniref:Uncharacterized protein n=1 Tax=Mycobacterium angelicum TaxID=470074 RepID=A0A1X0A187_MYCAN|nr:hypothetical protein [Mycobacterium angelicum]MCV7195407.1 hypothetical protein [Mycobacterium angelicum]ORA23829.1 hypothetical protein BST12_06640 [Mycobacterium angelicum]
MTTIESHLAAWHARNAELNAAVPLPDSFAEGGVWEDDEDGSWTRSLFGIEHGAAVRVSVGAFQSEDGRILEPNVWVEIDKQFGGLDPAGARQVAADLLRAADEVERL